MIVATSKLISSQAFPKGMEGSETRMINLRQIDMVKVPRAPDSVEVTDDDIVRATSKGVEVEIKNSTITKLFCFLGRCCTENHLRNLVMAESNLCENKLGELLEPRDSSSDHNVAGNGKRDGLKTDEYVAISSQAALKEVEGSTTRVISLRQIDKAKTPRAPSSDDMSDDDIVWTAEKSVDAEIKNSVITHRDVVRVFAPNTISHIIADAQPLTQMTGQIIVITPTFNETAADVTAGQEVFLGVAA